MSVFATWLADAARLTGYPVVEVSGWESRGVGGAGFYQIQGVVGHHTGGSAIGEYPSYNIVLNGRADLRGPLANLGIGRSGTIYVFAAGKCNHAGVSDWAGFTNLNDKFIGIEAESTGGGDWTDAQRDVYPRLVSSLLHYMERDASRYTAHRECADPKGRKPDPVGIDSDWLRNLAGIYLANLSNITVGSASIVPNSATPPVPVVLQNVPVKTSTALRLGSRGASVVALQQKLNKFGYGLTADGDFGQKTLAAVKDFQTKHGLKSDGVAGVLTSNALDQSPDNPTTPVNPPAPAFPGTVKKGDKNATVTKVQQRLRDRGWNITVDGDFGTGTDTIVRKFQAEKGLTSDGVVGPKTWAALWNAPVS